MDSEELQKIVTAIVENRRHNNARPFELLDSIHRRRFPADCFPVLEPLLHAKDGVTCKYAITIIGKLKQPPAEASTAIEAAWERSWEHGVPQACEEAFRALLRIGDNDERLLRMVDKAMNVDNYGIHKECAMTLMQVTGGDTILSRWSETDAGKCDCHLHKKLAKKITAHLNAG